VRPVLIITSNVRGKRANGDMKNVRTFQLGQSEQN
jgi:hypothetical protein